VRANEKPSRKNKKTKKTTKSCTQKFEICCPQRNATTKTQMLRESKNKEANGTQSTSNADEEEEPAVQTEEGKPNYLTQHLSSWMIKKTRC
jgi:hypothetical protein